VCVCVCVYVHVSLLVFLRACARANSCSVRLGCNVTCNSEKSRPRVAVGAVNHNTKAVIKLGVKWHLPDQAAVLKGMVGGGEGGEGRG